MSVNDNLALRILFEMTKSDATALQRAVMLEMYNLYKSGFLDYTINRDGEIAFYRKEAVRGD